ncbi:Myb-like_DNA-binding_domain_containing_protein (plasmid) [Leishmania braziliensis MHOM/BR/75/M2904]|uniref:Myb-like_DNA-binding_domain_containing_protein n=1 Tax=Leishmania braziliensis MHOM/BR/75/M2904 TaxID=420245 RepID=A0A3P3Z2V9_LEIBR|nr:Myb-like_DNA-binding_domain_containing_protein [Leishmania braziliensis MHOM/BR/75/M2904]
MSRLHFKGGAWTNAEDEVMKAALAQYGLRDWERVASMLTKKTATQCRERWENYLDPRLNIHEAWSLEEEEKLVEFQALFPHKWRLIAEQLTRRTPNHYIRPAWLCEQRYLELKDEQEYYLKEQQQQLKDVPGGAAGEKQSLESFMAERRRRRIARKTHEERASRADTVSGERCEREMIDMATSRLANQDQKKGLRKERQQQLAEAAFLAKLESNREGIESGTLSLRQTRKMKKALEEDWQTSGLVDEIAEPDEDDDASGEARDSGENEDDDERFEAIDMYEDQQKAGLVKKQRVLMKDLTEQQRLIQQRQMDSATDADGDDEATAFSSGSSRARAALTGVNQDLLKQLTSVPMSTPPLPLENNASGIRAIAAAGRSVAGASSIAEAAAAEAKEELKSTLADLFATLPSAARVAPPTALTSPGTGVPPPPPLPPLKRPREALKPVSVTGEENRDGSYPSEVAQQQAPEQPSRYADSSSVKAKRSDSGALTDLFDPLDTPAPRKVPKMGIAATAAADRSNGVSGETRFVRQSLRMRTLQMPSPPAPALPTRSTASPSQKLRQRCACKMHVGGSLWSANEQRPLRQQARLPRMNGPRRRRSAPLSALSSRSCALSMEQPLIVPAWPTEETRKGQHSYSTHHRWQRSCVCTRLAKVFRRTVLR